MQIEGVIRPVGASPFNRAGWCELVTRRPELRRPAPREIINPFTRKPTTVRATDDAAEILLGGNVIGHASWSMSEEPLVNVSIESAGLHLVREWAIDLHGEFVPTSSGSACTDA